jgi:hypothetical protein
LTARPLATAIGSGGSFANGWRRSSSSSWGPADGTEKDFLIIVLERWWRRSGNRSRLEKCGAASDKVDARGVVIVYEAEGRLGRVSESHAWCNRRR